MKRFIKENKIISAGLIISIVIIYIYIITIDMPEYFSGGGLMLEILNQVSIGFVISFVFYLTQVYIPQFKKKETINKHMKMRTNHIVEKMQESFNVLNEQYGNKDLENYSEQNMKLFLYLLPEEKTSYVNPVTLKNYTYAEYLSNNICFVEVEIERMFKYYIMEMPIELIELFEKIQECHYHKALPILLEFPKQRFSTDKDIFFKDYFNLMLKLKELEKNL